MTFVGTPQLGSPFRVIVTVTTSGMGAARYRADDKLYLNAWIDWNADGNWSAFEKIIEWNGGPGLNDGCTKGKLVKPTTPWHVDNNSRVLEFDVTVPVTTIPYYRIGKPYYSRFRLDYDENVNITTGPAKFGEVEDYEHEPPITEVIPTLTPIGCILTLLLLSGLGAIRIRKVRK